MEIIEDRAGIEEKPLVQPSEVLDGEVEKTGDPAETAGLVEILQ